MENSINSKGVKGNKRTMNNRPVVTNLAELKDDRFYRVGDLQAILEDLGCNYSIFTIRDYETWKCINYECGKRFNEEVANCMRCGGSVRSPIIPSPRTRGGGKGVGHRRYTGADIKEIVAIFKERM